MVLVLDSFSFDLVFVKFVGEVLILIGFVSMDAFFAHFMKRFPWVNRLGWMG
jgi:hypothetical protein